MWALKAKQGLVVKSVLVVVVVLAAGGIYFGFIKKNTSTPISKSTSSTNKPASPSVVEKVDSSSIKTALASSDYATYQSLQRSQALLYVNNSQVSDAERVMSDVIKYVPTSDVTSGSYLTMVSIQKAKNDTAQEKKYLQLAIAALNAEGNPQQAANEQKYLDSLK